VEHNASRAGRSRLGTRPAAEAAPRARPGGSGPSPSRRQSVDPGPARTRQQRRLGGSRCQGAAAPGASAARSALIARAAQGAADLLSRGRCARGGRSSRGLFFIMGVFATRPSQPVQAADGRPARSDPGGRGEVGARLRRAAARCLLDSRPREPPGRGRWQEWRRLFMGLGRLGGGVGPAGPRRRLVDRGGASGSGSGGAPDGGGDVRRAAGIGLRRAAVGTQPPARCVAAPLAAAAQPPHQVPRRRALWATVERSAWPVHRTRSAVQAQQQIGDLRTMSGCSTGRVRPPWRRRHAVERPVKNGKRHPRV
jgi:hypothetical protein